MPPFLCTYSQVSRGRASMIFDFFLHLFTNRTQLTTYHQITGEGFTPFFLHLSFTLISDRKFASMFSSLVFQTAIFR